MCIVRDHSTEWHGVARRSPRCEIHCLRRATPSLNTVRCAAAGEGETRLEDVRTLWQKSVGSLESDVHVRVVSRGL